VTHSLEEKSPSAAVDLRGRSEFGFISALRGELSFLRTQVREQLERAGALDGPFVSIEHLRTLTDAALQDSRELSVIGETLHWSRAVTTPRAVAAFERSRDALEPLATWEGPPPLDGINDSVPGYWDYEFHGTTGGWDGHEHMGFIHFEIVYQLLLANAYGDIFATRGVVAAEAPSDSYSRIVDLGAGTGQYSMKLAETYPDAQLTLVDISETSLNYALRRAANAGLRWDAVRAPAESTGLASGEFDLVTSFILLHEVPPPVAGKIFEEAYRLLQPGGHLHFSDVTPYRVRSRYQAWLDDWDAEIGNEPWWRSAATLDLVELAESAGFVDVQQRGLGSDSYPWVTTATKPGRA
jgi:SAM-dependent methyltransferase